MVQADKMTAIALEGSFIYRSPLHSGSVLAALNVLWKQQDLCDVTILVDGYHLQAHKAVLAACSAYFRGLFTDPKREKDISMVEMHGVSVTGFKSLLDFMYSSSLTLNAQNIYDVHNAATFLGMQEAAQVCMQIFDKAAKTEKAADETPQHDKQIPWEHPTEGRGSARSSAAGTPMQSPSQSSQSSNSSNNTPAQSPMAASPQAATVPGSSDSPLDLTAKKVTPTATPEPHPSPPTGPLPPPPLQMLPRFPINPGETNMNTTRALLLNSRHPHGVPDPTIPMPPPPAQPLEGAAKRKKRSLSSVVNNLVESKSKQDAPAHSSKSQHPIQQVEVRNSNSFTYRSGSNVGSMIVTSSAPTPAASTGQPITIPPIIIKDVFSLNNNYINTSVGSKKGPPLFSSEARPAGFNSPPTSLPTNLVPPPPPTGHNRLPQPQFPLPQGMPMLMHHIPTSIPQPLPGQPRGHILPQMVLRPPNVQPALRAPMQHPRVPPRQAYKFHQYVRPGPPQDQAPPLRMEDVRAPPSALNKDEQAPLPHQIRIPQASASDTGRIKMDKMALLKQLREPQQLPSPPKPNPPRPDTASHFGLISIPPNRPLPGIPPPQPRKEQEPFQQDDQQTRFYLNLVDYRNKHMEKQPSAQPVSVSVHPPSHLQSLPHNSTETIPVSQSEATRPTYPPPPPLLVDPRHVDPRPLSPPEVDLYRPKTQGAETASMEETIILMPEDFQKKKRRHTSTTEESAKKPRHISMEEAVHASSAVSIDGREEEPVISRPRSICSDPGLPTETMRKAYMQDNEDSATSVCSPVSVDEPQENGLSASIETVRSRHSSEPSDVHKRDCKDRSKVFELGPPEEDVFAKPVDMSQKEEDGEEGHEGEEAGVTSIQEGDSYRCSTCNKTFTDHDQFRTHVREEHVNHKVHECEKCHATFKYSGALKTHMRVHTGEKPFACDKCGARFTQLGNLHRHKKTHDGLKPYQCGLCNARFTRLGSVQEHLKIHTGEKKPFQCKVCTAEFTRHGHLRNHMRIHSGERPFSCSVCGAQFRHPGGLKQHKKIHQRTCFETSPHICESCGALFTRLGDLRTHRKLHDGGKATQEDLDGDMSD